MGALRTSEEAVAVAGEGRQARHDADRAVDAGEAKIIIAAEPTAPPRQLPPAPRPLPQPVPTMPAARSGGLWLVIAAYVLASAALAAAIYDRFLV